MLKIEGIGEVSPENLGRYSDDAKACERARKASIGFGVDVAFKDGTTRQVTRLS